MDELEKLLLEVQQLNESKEYKKVIDLLSDSKLERYKSADLYAEKAMAYYKLKDYAQCETNADISLEINPNNAKGNNYKGAILNDNNEFENAIQYYKRAIEGNPNYVAPYNNIGTTFMNLKMYDQAIKFYENAIELDSNFSTSYIGLGSIYLKQKSYDKAILAYNKAIEIDYNYRAYNGLACVYFDQKDYDQAIKFYNKAIECDPTDDGPYYNLGLTYYNKKEYQKALEIFEKYLVIASDISPNSNFISLANARVVEINKFLYNVKYKEISEIVNKIKELLIFKDECITHYTSLSAAKALILDKSKFRLSEGAFLNDTSEGRELFHYLSIPISKRLIEAESILFAQKPFIGSFVTETKHDDLTLWRMYGKEDKDEAKGCAITIDMECLLKNLKDTLTLDSSNNDLSIINEEFTFFRVVYRKLGSENEFVIPGAEDKQQILKKYMVELSKKVKKFTSAKEDEKYENKDLIERLNEIAYLFKSIEYQHENEIRLVIKGVGFNKKIDVNPPKVYIELVPIRSFINKITLGPKVDRAEEWAATFFYSLEKDEFKPCIHISHLPFK